MRRQRRIPPRRHRPKPPEIGQDPSRTAATASSLTGKALELQSGRSILRQRTRVFPRNRRIPVIRRRREGSLSILRKPTFSRVPGRRRHDRHRGRRAEFRRGRDVNGSLFQGHSAHSTAEDGPNRFCTNERARHHSQMAVRNPQLQTKNIFRTAWIGVNDRYAWNRPPPQKRFPK